MKFGTKAIHGGQRPDPSTGAIMTPIYQTSTFVQDAPGHHQGYAYARTGNPTRTALEANIAAIENAKHGICFASGMGAVDAVLKLLKPGDEVISTNDLYGGTYRSFTKIFERFGVKFNFVSMMDPSAIEEIFNEHTKLVWVETPTNPMMNVIDIQTITEIAHHHGVKVCVDNTFATPFLQNPIDLGADIVLHSATKYLGGHSDVILGALATNDDRIADDLRFIQNSTGATPGPMDCFLVLRGIKTLHVRMQRHCENASAIANFLKRSSLVKDVYWPGFTDHPNHEVAKKQMRDFGGMISFNLKKDTFESAIKVLSATKVFSLAESLGGVESLIGHPASMTHASIPLEERLKVGVTDSLIRLSVGIEDVSDLLEDIENAICK